MKNILFLLLLFCSTASAQEIYNIVLDGATRTVNSPTASFTDAQIAQFKRTTLVYLKNKAFETQEEVTEQFLDTQAYYLSEFISFYFKQVMAAQKESKSRQGAVIKGFINVSLEHPLFHDPDTDTTQAFLFDETSLTPFSLDTNWEEAYREVTKSEGK